MNMRQLSNRRHMRGGHLKSALSISTVTYDVELPNYVKLLETIQVLSNRPVM